MMKQGGKWELAPAYDLCHAYRPGSEWVSRHALSINGKRNDISKKDLLITGESAGLRKPSEIIGEINHTVNNFRKFAGEVLVTPKLRDEIGKTLLDLR